MYICKDCKNLFENAQKFLERHNLDTPPYEEISVCPHCNSERIVEEEKRYCRCCGARLPYGIYGYCNSACRKKGERMWRLQEEKRLLAQSNPLIKLTRALDLYNALNHTNYSYGEFVTLVLPRLSKKEKRKYL